MIATTITAIARMIVSSCAIFASWRQVDEPEVREANRERCVSYFTLRRLSKKCNVAKKPHTIQGLPKGLAGSQSRPHSRATRLVLAVPPVRHPSKGQAAQPSHGRQ